jgi:hypothetical protein
MATITKAPREKLTLRDTTDLLIAVNQYIEDHVDEIELNGGALPDDLAAMLDEIVAGQMDKVDAIAAKLDEFSGYASAAKATKDRAARRQRVWENAAASLRAYAFLQVVRVNGGPHGFIKGKSSTLRIQRNGQPSTDLTIPKDGERSIAIVPSHQAVLLAAVAANQPLARFVTVERVAHLDKKALGAAYEARRAQLEDESSLLGESDIPESTRQMLDAEPNPEDVAGALADLRARYVADNLRAEFPGVRCERGQHLRID